MSPIHTQKHHRTRKTQRRGPKAKPIEDRILTPFNLKPIRYPERTYSQMQKIRVLTFLEHQEIPLTRNGEYRKPTQLEASDFYQIPQRTISDWVRKKEKIAGLGKRSPVKMAEDLGYAGRVFWPELEEGYIVTL